MAASSFDDDLEGAALRGASEGFISVGNPTELESTRDQSFGSNLCDRGILSGNGVPAVSTNRVAMAMLRSQSCSRWRSESFHARRYQR